MNYIVTGKASTQQGQQTEGQSTIVLLIREPKNLQLANGLGVYTGS